MPTELAVIILAVAALFTGALYLMTRRRRRKKKSASPVRPAAPTNQTAGVASTWAPPPAARPAIAPSSPPVAAPAVRLYGHFYSVDECLPCVRGEWRRRPLEVFRPPQHLEPPEGEPKCH